jgi:hypothetical protein
MDTNQEQLSRGTASAAHHRFEFFEDDDDEIGNQRIDLIEI